MRKNNSVDVRLNTKRVISANIASAARVQNQNGEIIAACQQELRRRDLQDEWRAVLLDRMDRAAESTARVDAASREFQRQQQEWSRKSTRKTILLFAGPVFFGIGGGALIRVAA